MIDFTTFNPLIAAASAAIGGLGTWWLAMRKQSNAHEVQEEASMFRARDALDKINSEHHVRNDLRITALENANRDLVLANLVLAEGRASLTLTVEMLKVERVAWQTERALLTTQVNELREEVARLKAELNRIALINYTGEKGEQGQAGHTR